MTAVRQRAEALIRANPDRVRTELARLRDHRAQGYRDGKDWARELLGVHVEGGQVRPGTLGMVCEALGISHA